MLLLLSPVLLILMLLVRVKLGSPVFFTQDRPGRNGRIFKMYKFRSMTDARDREGNLLPDDVRLTSFGKKLRSTSLDELPELFNVLKGDMALIGPRPLLVSYLPLYNARQSRRHLERPGITGYAQAYGRNSITWEEKFDKDVYYVDHLSFLLDLKIIAQTVRVVLKREGIDAAGGGTMAAFAGSPPETFIPRVLILANDSSGLWLFRRNLLETLKQEGMEVTAVFPDDVYAGQIGELGAAVRRIPLNRRSVNPLEDLRLLRAYKNLLQELSPDVVLTYTIKPNVYGGMACRRMRIPYIATVTGLGTAFEKGGFLGAVVTTLYRRGLKGAEAVFFQNDVNRGLFLEKRILTADKARLVNGSGVDLEKYQALSYPGHADDVTRFLYLGRLMREKGIVELISAAGAMHDKYGGRVSFAAAGYDEEDGRQLVEDAVLRGILKRLPFQKDTIPLYREADVVVLPTWHEGMSNVLMEAGACARPVIASDIPGCREIAADGETGFLIRPRSMDSLLEAMEKFMALSVKEREEMGRRGRAKMEKEFDRRFVVAAYLSEIKRILS